MHIAGPHLAIVLDCRTFRGDPARVGLLGAEKGAATIQLVYSMKLGWEGLTFTIDILQ